MLRPRRNSNTPDQSAARIFEARLKRHVQENPECQWELDWYRQALKKSVRRSRVLIDQEVEKLTELGWPLCDEFIQELAKPHSHLDDEAQSPESDLSVSHPSDQYDEWTPAGDSSPEEDSPLDARSPAHGASLERNTSFDSVTTLGNILEEGARQPASGPQPMIPQIQLTAPQPSSETEGYPITGEAVGHPIAGDDSVVREVKSQAPPANSVAGGKPVTQAADNPVASDPGSSSGVQRTVHQPGPTKPIRAPSGRKAKPPPRVEHEQAVPALSQAPSAGHPRIGSRGTPARLPEPQLDLDTLPKPGKVPPRAQVTDKPLPKQTPIPSQTSETKTQRITETVDDPQRGRPAVPKHDSSPGVPQSRPKISPPSIVQAPKGTKPAQLPPIPKPITRPDLPSTVVGGAQQVVADRGGSLTADLSPIGWPNIRPYAKLPSPEPIKPGADAKLPGERAPKIDLKIDDHPLFTPISAPATEVESARTPRDTVGPQPRTQPESPIPPEDPEPQLDPTAAEASRLSKEAGRLAQQFGSYGNLDDLNEAIETYGRAAELLAPGPDSLAISGYLNLGRMMRIKFEAFNDIKDLDSAFDDALVKAHHLLLSGPTNELYSDALYELGAASLDRYLYDGTEAAGDEAHRYCELALSAESPISGPKRAEIHCVQSRLHLARFEYLSRAEDAINALQTLDAASEADPTLNGEARYMENRARTLFACYQTRRPEYTGSLDEALGLARQARNLTPTTTIQHPIVSTLLAELLLARYERSHHQPNLDAALELLERAVRQVSYVRPEQPWIGGCLARALISRFVNQGDPEDLNDAISFLEIALNLTVTNPYRRRARLDSFGGALTLRFRYLALGEELSEDGRRELLAGTSSM